MRHRLTSGHSGSRGSSDLIHQASSHSRSRVDQRGLGRQHRGRGPRRRRGRPSRGPGVGVLEARILQESLDLLVEQPGLLPQLWAVLEVVQLAAFVRTLPHDDGNPLLALVAEQGENLSHGGEDDRLVSGVFADVTNHETRVQLVDALFAVASADQVIYRSEAAAIRAIAREVGLKKDDLDQINAGYEHFIQS